MLEARNSSQIDDFFTKSRHENFDVYCISQSCFALLRQSIRNNSDRLKLFKQTLRDVEGMYKDIGGYDMKNDEFKEMCRKTWKEKVNYLCIDMTTKKMEVNLLFSMKAKTLIQTAFPKVKLFKLYEKKHKQAF